MKKFFKVKSKLNIFVMVLAAVCFILPTVLTLYFMNEKVSQDNYESMIFSARKEPDDIPVISSANDLEITPYQIIGGDKPVVLQKDTTAVNPLTLMSKDAGLATLSDASDEDSSIDKASDNDPVEKKVSAEKPSDDKDQEKKASKDKTSEEQSDEDKSDEDDSVDDETGTSSDADEEDAIIPNGKKVYLTFDDGPSCYTEDILEVLKKYNVKATFFVVAGSKDYEKELKEIAADGHTIGLHSYTHVYSEIYKDLKSFSKDVESVHDWVKDVTGIDTKYYRFPGGSDTSVTDLKTSDCVAYLKRRGYEFYDWNALSGDAEGVGYSSDQLVENVMYSVHENEGDSIVLMHDSSTDNGMIDALPDIIESLIEEGYELRAIDDDAPHAHQYCEDQ